MSTQNKLNENKSNEVVIRVCPRCKSVYSYIERKKVYGREYLYAVHEYRENGKRHKKRCYLGPAEGYIYTSLTHRDSGLVFFGADDPKRYLRYLYDELGFLMKECEEDSERFVKKYQTNAEELMRLAMLMSALASRFVTIAQKMS